MKKNYILEQEVLNQSYNSLSREWYKAYSKNIMKYMYEEYIYA